jgi:hypothetical protein
MSSDPGGSCPRTRIVSIFLQQEIEILHKPTSKSNPKTIKKKLIDIYFLHPDFLSCWQDKRCVVIASRENRATTGYYNLTYILSILTIALSLLAMETRTRDKMCRWKDGFECTLVPWQRQSQLSS